tara:strand:- start:1065 stop:1901 length:837 start_codon:yes stop_codon:yes gene_type:complete
MPGTKGGLMEAIEKVKAKEMQGGGEAKNRTNAKKFKKNVAADRKSKITKTLDKKNPVRALARIVDDEFESSNIQNYGGIHVGGKVYTDKDEGPNKRLYKPQKPSKVGPKKMAKGGMARGRRPRPIPMRAMSKLDDAVEEFIETIEPFQGTVRKGEKLRNIDGKTMIIRQMPNPNFSGNTISDRDRAMVGAMLGEGGRMISDADRRMISQMMGARRMEDGGVVPAKFKGFSKLPEDVQQKMNPTLAKKFKKGGPVKMGSGGGVCRGMGAARAGGKFKLR